MFRSVLVVCVGNICRSPVGERLLAQKLAERGAAVTVASAGLGAVLGHGVDETAAAVAAAHGLSVEGHVARQFGQDLALRHDLILVMEPGHRASILERAPSLAGRVMLFDQWVGAKGIADPYRRSREFHEIIFTKIDEAATAWANKLAPRSGTAFS